MDRILKMIGSLWPKETHGRKHLRWLCVISLILMLASVGCGGGGGSSPGPVNPSQQNTAPTASAGDDLSMPAGSTAVLLDGSGSSDPELDALDFSWQITRQPAGAGAALDDATAARPSFASMIPGEYHFELTVADPEGLTGTDSVVVTLTNDPPVISVAPFNHNPVLGSDVTIDASASADPNGHAFTCAWEVVEMPDGSAMQKNYQGDAPTLQFDAIGRYVLQLQASDPYDTSSLTFAHITVVASGENTSPHADAGPDTVQTISKSAQVLDGSGSSDPQQDPISFSWRVESQPTGADITVNDPTSPQPTFQASVPGVYQFILTVTDNSGNAATDTVAVTLTNDPPTISVAPFEQYPAVGENVTIDASASTDPNGHALTFTWTLVQFPEDTGVPLAYEGAAPTLQFDVQGEYVLRLQVSDGFETTVRTLDPVVVNVFKVTQLGSGFDDAEYDKAGDRIVTVKDDTLFVIDADGSESTVALPTDATAVSVAPDGLTAAVAHDGWVSHVDLNSLSVMATHSVPANLGDVVIDGEGYAYGFPQSGGWVDIQVIDLATGDVQEGTGYSINDGTRAKLHPSGTKIYGADNGSSPSDLERYSIGGGGAHLDYDSPYHGDFPFCGDLWYGPGGKTILSRCRVIVHATDHQNSDLGFAMQLDNQGNRIQHASSSAYENQWFVVDADNSYTGASSDHVNVYDVQGGRLSDTLMLPWLDESQHQRWSARFVFAADDSTALYVLAVDDHSTPGAFALLKRLDPDFTDTNLAPRAVVRRYTTATLSSAVTLDAGNSIDPEGQPVTFQWRLAAAPDGSHLSLDGLNAATLAFTPEVTGVYEFELTVNDGVRESPTARATVNVFGPEEDVVHRLEGLVADAEFSKSLNALVYLSAMDQNLHILNISDYSETVVALNKVGYTVGVSPDGLFAAVSHAGEASLVDLTLAIVTDTQTYSQDWGDIVLDHNQRAHLVPRRDQWSQLVSLDFMSNETSTVYGPYAGTQVRMHPVSGWVYGADRGLSPSDFEKWDVSSFPAVSEGDSPYHGDYGIGGNIWISEDGDRLVVAGSHTFWSSADPDTDMTYAGALEDRVFIAWADHSTETGEWAVVTAESYFGDDPLENKLIFYDETYFRQQHVLDFAAIPTPTVDASTTANRVFYSDDGSRVIVLLEGEGLIDKFALQILSP